MTMLVNCIIKFRPMILQGGIFFFALTARDIIGDTCGFECIHIQ